MDRAEAMAAGGLVVLAGAPLAAVAAGHAVYSTSSRTAHAQQATWPQVPAVLAASAPAAGFRQYQVAVQAGWTALDGTRHAGTVLAPPEHQGRPRGDGVGGCSWQAHRPLAAPVAAGARPGGAGHHAHPLAVGVMLLCAGLLAHAVLGRRRLAAWDTDWQVTEPQWTKGR